MSPTTSEPRRKPTTCVDGETYVAMNLTLPWNPAATPAPNHSSRSRPADAVVATSWLDVAADVARLTATKAMPARTRPAYPVTIGPQSGLPIEPTSSGHTIVPVNSTA